MIILATKCELWLAQTYRKGDDAPAALEGLVKMIRSEDTTWISTAGQAVSGERTGQMHRPRVRRRTCCHRFRAGLLPE